MECKKCGAIINEDDNHNNDCCPACCEAELEYKTEQTRGELTNRRNGKL